MAFVPVDRPAQRLSSRPATAKAAPVIPVRDDDKAFRLAVLLAAWMQGDLADEARANEVRCIAFDLVTALGGAGMGALRERSDGE